MTTTERPSSQTERTERATYWCVAAVDQAIGRLSTEVGRMDAIDLAAPWRCDEPTRRDRVLTLIEWLDASTVPRDATDGRPLAASLVRAWSRRRGEQMDRAMLDDQAAALVVLRAVSEVRIALDVGVDRVDMPTEAQ